MSRGHGSIERAILDAAGTGRLLALVYIAARAGYDPENLSVRQSFGRAARRLEAQKKLDIYLVKVHTATTGRGERPTNFRRILCACQPGTEITPEMSDRAHFSAMAVYDPEFIYEWMQEQKGRAHAREKIQEVFGVGPARADELIAEAARAREGTRR